MQLIVGLGNPESKYNFTRHNFGFLALDFYAKIHNIDWQKPKMGALWFKDGNRLFIKPQNYYNNSGEAVQAFMHFYKIPPENILVVCDDFDLPFGTLRYRAKGSSGGNNGLKSISERLGTTEFPRLRIGSNNPAIRQKVGDIDFVLGKFTSEEKAELPQILSEMTTKIDDFSWLLRKSVLQ